jgi:hypothetical protein
MKSSKRKIEATGANVSDPGFINQTLRKRLKKILNIINFK